jgi:hypothetical protein
MGGRTNRALALAAVGALVATVLCVGAGPSTAATVSPRATGNGYVNWKTPADVAGGLKANGFTCKKDGSLPEATPGYRVDGKPTRSITFMACDGYNVVLLRNVRKAHAIEKAGCRTATAADWDTMSATRGLTGKNFYVISSSADHSFPAQARPEDFQKVFGGIVETDAQFLTRMFGCRRPAS